MTLKLHSKTVVLLYFTPFIWKNSIENTEFLSFLFEKFKYEIFNMKKKMTQCSFCALSKESNTIHIILLME